MQPSDNTTAQITSAISVLQDAVRKAAFDKKAVRADIVKAANILMGLLSLPGVAPDIDPGN